MRRVSPIRLTNLRNSSPNLHGRDLIAPLARLLSITSMEASSVLQSAFSSVRFLICEEILNFTSFVKKFAHLENDPRFLVKSGFLELFGRSLAPSHYSWSPLRLPQKFEHQLIPEPCLPFSRRTDGSVELTTQRGSQVSEKTTRGAPFGERGFCRQSRLPRGSRVFQRDPGSRFT